MALPDYTKTLLDISNKRLTELPDDLHLYIHLQILDCESNKLTQLNNLPPIIKILFCHNNNITHLDNLPNELKYLYCENNKITKFNNLPQSLKELDCYENPLEYDFNPTLANIRKHNATSN